MIKIIKELITKQYPYDNRKEIRDYLNNLLRGGQCKKIYIVTGENKIFNNIFFDAIKSGVELYPSMKIEIIAKLKEQEFENIKKRTTIDEKNLKIYKVKRRPTLHFWLIRTKENKIHLYLQRKHIKGSSKDEWFVENPLFLSLKYILTFYLYKIILLI